MPAGPRHRSSVSPWPLSVTATLPALFQLGDAAGEVTMTFPHSRMMCVAIVMFRADGRDLPATLAVPGRANANVSLAASGSFVVAVWSAAAPSGDTDVFARRARPGRTFSAPARVNSTPGDARVNGEQPPRLALRSAAGHHPKSLWSGPRRERRDETAGPSRDAGRTFLPPRWFRTRRSG